MIRNVSKVHIPNKVPIVNIYPFFQAFIMIISFQTFAAGDCLSNVTIKWSINDLKS